MATFSICVLPHQKKMDGTWNVKIRVTQNRRSKYISSPFFADKSDLTKSFKIKNQIFLDECQKEIKKYRDKLNEFGFLQKDFSIERVMSILLKEDVKKISFKNFLNEHRNEISCPENVDVALKSFLNYINKDDVFFDEIKFIDVDGWLKSIHTSPTTKKNYTCNIRRVFNLAKRMYNDEDNGIVPIPNNPFAKLKHETIAEPAKRAISSEQLKAFMNIECDHKQKTVAKDLFMLSFYLVGMNLIDIYNVKKSCYNDGRITYERSKTKDRRADRSLISIRIEPEVQPIIDKYINNGEGENLFSFFKLYTFRSIGTITNTNLHLLGKSIGVPNLQFYAARHTWATIAVNEAGVDKYTVHLSLNHVDDKTAITDIYIKKDWSLIDIANRKVIDYILSK